MTKHPPARALPPRPSRVVLAAAVVAAALAAAACGTGSTSLAGPTEGKCQISVTSFTRTFGPSGGSGTVTLKAARECSWSAASPTEWISFPAAPAGQGEGSFAFAVGANPVPRARQGTIEVSGQKLGVSQDAAPCQFAADPAAVAISAAGGDGVVKVSTVAGCAWTARSLVAWLTITAGASGEGPGEVRFSVQPNPGAARTTELQVAGRTVRVEQAAAGEPSPPPPPPPQPPPPSAPPPPAACEYALSPAASNIPASGGTVTLSLATGSACQWQASSDVSWATVGPPASGTGPASIPVAVAPNPTTASRTATISVGGATARITQEASAPACSYTVAPASATVPAAGGEVRVDLQTGSTCAWTAATNADWLTATPAAGAGSATVILRATENASTTERAATATIGGQQVIVTQPGAAPSCSYQVTPEAGSLPAAGGNLPFQVATQDGCAWNATTEAVWLTVVPISGTGQATVTVSAGANTDTAARTGTVSIAGTAVTITQEGANPPAPTEIQVEGKIQNLAGSCPIVTFSLIGYIVNTTASTAYLPNPPGVACGDLRDGLSVLVVGSLLPERVITATQITLERDLPRP